MTEAWEAFGSDDDDSDNSEEEQAIQGQPGSNGSTAANEASTTRASMEVALYLAKSFLHTNSKVPIAKRAIALKCMDQEDMEDSGSQAVDSHILKPWKDALVQRGFECTTTKSTKDPRKVESISVTDWKDAFLFVQADTEVDNLSDLFSQAQNIAHESIVPGGLLLIAFQSNGNVSGKGSENFRNHVSNWDEHFADGKNPFETVYADDNLQVLAFRKRLVQIQEKTCPWLPSKHSIPKERQRAQEATIFISSHEIHQHCLAETSIQKAVKMLQDYGYCIIPRLLDPDQALQWGNAVLQDLHQAAKILLENEKVDIFHPHTSQKDPQSYRELSMREDLRMDLRDGPQLRKIRGCIGNKPIILKANEIMRLEYSQNGTNEEQERLDPFFRHDPSVLEVVRRTMNPKVGDLYKGNFGRYNFSGSGPDGSFQDMRLGWIGGIVSLPGSADQALHADAPHLFETGTLPAHYINAFTPGCRGSPSVGCTAFIYGSHTIEFTTKYMGEEEDSEKVLATKGKTHEAVFDYLVRPQLELGDVLLFDCRTLHFGLSNTSKDIERPLVYCNMTHAWFTDPKNWVNERPIFDN